MRLFTYIIIPFLFISCAEKVQKPTVTVVKLPKKPQPTEQLKRLTNNIRKHCKIDVKQHHKYLQISIDKDKSFNKNSQLLTKQTKKYLHCFIPFIKEEKAIIIQLNALAKNEDKKQAQNISDNRAINAAELFYNNGVRSEIYAKGCIEGSMNIDIHIFIYSKKEYFRKHCK